MANDTTITITGFLGSDPELKFTQSGKPVANLSIASTPRRFDKARNEWMEGETLWVRAHAWGHMAENVAESLAKGMLVVAHGRLEAHSYTTQTGEKRTSMELDLDHIGPSLRTQRAQVARVMQDAPQGQGQGNGQAPYAAGQAAPPAGAWGATFQQAPL